MKKMINVKVEKVGVSFQGGLYPENLVEQVVARECYCWNCYARE